MTDNDPILEHLVGTWLLYGKNPLQERGSLQHALEGVPNGGYALVLYYRGRGIVRYSKDISEDVHDRVKNRKDAVKEALLNALDLRTTSERIPASVQTEDLYWTLEQTYHDITEAVEMIEYARLESEIECLLGIAEEILEPNPTLHDKYYEVLSKAKEGYEGYIKRAERRESEVRESGDSTTADEFLECIGSAEEGISKITRILKDIKIH